MKLQQFLFSLLISGSPIVLLITPAMSEEIRVLDVKPKNRATDRRISDRQPLRQLTLAQPRPSTKKIQQLSEIERPFTSAQKLVQSPKPSPQAAPEVLEVTNVKIQSTQKGLEIILETTAAEKLQVINKSEGNNFIADIKNAQLRLPSGDVFRFSSNKPIDGITEIVVTNQDANTIRVTVTGTTSAPTAELFDNNQALIFGVTPPASSTDQAPQPQPPQESETVQPESSTPPKQPSTGKDEPIELVVTGQGDSYRTTEASTATRTDTPIRDIPQSIQVVPRQVLEDQQVIRVGDALQNVSGVNNLGSYGGYEESITIRGFNVDTFQGNYFRDGIRLFTFGFPETADLERIEVLKGPASVLFGQAQPGGIINLVTKQPLADPYYSPRITIGNYDTYQAWLDLSGPLNDKKTVRYRLNTFYENSGSFRDFVEKERFFISPVITWEISPNTSLTIDAEFTDDSRTIDDGLVAIGDRPADLPRSRFLSEPFSNFQKQDYSIGYLFNHRFSESLSLRHSFRAQWVYPERYYPLSSSLDEETGELSRLAYWSGGSYQNLNAQTDLIAKVSTGSIKHLFLVGFEFGKTVENPDFYFEDYEPINIFNPVYTRRRYPKGKPSFVRDDVTKTYGIYLQDQISLLPNLKLLLGGRFDSFDQDRSLQSYPDPREEFEQSDSKFSPRVGIVYQPTEEVSLYASYTKSFLPSSGSNRNAGGSAFEPETGTQYEVGVKTDLLDNKLSATLAAFEIKKQNVTTDDPNVADPTFQLQTGEQTSRGIELDIAGTILPGWKIIASYAYIDAFISKDNNFPEGNQLDNAPKHTASLWTTYEIQRGGLEGLGFGLGLYYVGDRQGDLDNTFILPSYLRTDATLFYKRSNWRAAINIKNLFDVEYFTAASFGSRVNVQPGAPFTILGTFSIEF